MDTPDLTAFVQVADTRSFSIAAVALHLTQSAVSRRIAALERELGTRLFDRVGRSVTLTEAGATLLPRARRILREIDDSRILLRNLSGDVGGSLLLGTSHHIGLHRLPGVLRTFSDRHPEVALELQFLDSEAAHDLLLQGQIELAVVTLPPSTLPPLASRIIWSDPLVFAVAPDHPLARRPQPELVELGAHRAVLPGSGTYTGRIVTAMFATAGIDLDATMSTNYLETIRMMAGIGLGWTVLPATMLDERLVRIEPRGAPAMERQLGWLRHPNRTASNAASAFLDILETHADQR
ncbi:MAG: LysR family transcriptional regulator [Gammaproteobacteria bacterium]|nr:MAG: LysR family transcriptional regulator [Gammaproteobacteria bacterium]